MPRRLSVASLVGLALVAEGAVLYLHRIGAVGHGAQRALLLLIGAVGLLILVLRVEPAWLVSGALFLTMFAGHWTLLGLSATAGPDRILLAAAVGSVLFRIGPSRRRPPIELHPVHLLMAAALAYSVTSAILAHTITRHSSIFQLLDQFGVFPFAMFLLGPVIFTNERHRRILLGTLLAAGAYLSLTALFEKVGGLNGLIWPSYITDPSVGIHFGRARGPFADAGADGIALFECVVAAAVACVTWLRGRARIAGAAIVVLGLLGVLMTATRGVWLCAGVATAAVMVLTPELRRFLLPVGLGGTLLVLGAFAAIPGLSHQVQSRFNEQSPVWERQNTTAAGLRMVAARPLLGFGWDTGNDHLNDYFRVNPHIPFSGAHAGFHNIYLQYGVGLGLLGLALWLSAIGSACALALRRGARAGIVRAEEVWGRPWPRSEVAWRAGLAAILLAWMVIGLTAPADYIFSTLLLWLWCGAIWGADRGQLPVGASAWRHSQGEPPARGSPGEARHRSPG